MKNEQVLADLNHLLDYLNQQINEIRSSHEKFLIALTGILKLTNDGGPILTNLHADPENLKSYLIQMTMQIFDLTTRSCEGVCTRIESIIEAMSIDRKS
ncbi:MAG: hypothetical protein OEV85_08725 [Candidatus Thorarchaeota archaeon]|nr:hypothetical protein [Candidatus Thorarchaeota archaeon]